MSESRNERSRLKWVGGVIWAAVGGLVVTVLVSMLFYRTGGLSDTVPPVVLTGEALQLASGQGGPIPAGLEVRQPGPEGLAAVQGLGRLARAAVYRHLIWQVDGLARGRELRLIWITLAEPDTVRELVLPPTGPGGGTLDLSSEPYWRDRIAMIGLSTSGPLAQPLVFRRLELRPSVLGLTALARLAFDEWTTFEDWSQRSINFVAGAPLDALFPPVLMVALWIGFSAILYAVFSGLRGTVERRWSYVTLFLVGWLLLDVRWQWDLSQRLAGTAVRFAGKGEDERRLADLDGDLYRFLIEVRRRLPEQPARLFIVSADPGGFWAGRARYHLLPHNDFMRFLQPPRAGTVRKGDYILVLSPLAGVRYSRERRALEWENQRLPAEMLHAEASRGALFRVQGE